MKSKAIITTRLLTVNDIDEINSCLPGEHKLDAKRQLRKPLLSSLDVYDKNVSKGRIVETEEQKKNIKPAQK